MKRILTFTTVAFALTTSVSAQTSISADSINVAQQMIIDRMDSLPEVQVKGHRPMFKMKDGELVTQVKGTPLEHETTLGIVDFSQTEDYHERYVRLTVTYRFNQKKAKYRGKNSAEQEMNRL